MFSLIWSLITVPIESRASFSPKAGKRSEYKVAAAFPNPPTNLPLNIGPIPGIFPINGNMFCKNGILENIWLIINCCGIAEINFVNKFFCPTDLLPKSIPLTEWIILRINPSSWNKLLLSKVLWKNFPILDAWLPIIPGNIGAKKGNISIIPFCPFTKPNKVDDVLNNPKLENAPSGNLPVPMKFFSTKFWTVLPTALRKKPAIEKEPCWDVSLKLDIILSNICFSKGSRPLFTVLLASFVIFLIFAYSIPCCFAPFLACLYMFVICFKVCSSVNLPSLKSFAKSRSRLSIWFLLRL